MYFILTDLGYDGISVRMFVDRDNAEKCYLETRKNIKILKNGKVSINSNIAGVAMLEGDLIQQIGMDMNW